MTDADRVRWDRRHAERTDPAAERAEIDEVFLPYLGLFPTRGSALDLACGQGRAAVWLALRGLDVLGVDVSPVAIRQARELARTAGVSNRCHFDVVDLDDGLPAGPDAVVIHCRRFRDRRLDGAIGRRLAPGGLLAVTALRAADGVPTAFRVAAGELPAAFPDLEPIATGHDEDQQWLLARRPDAVS